VQTFEQLKRQIINTLSHELRTPLTYIQGYTALALESPPTAEDFGDFLLSIRRGADRLTRLVEDMLLLVRLDTGQAADEFKVLSILQSDLGEVIQRTVRQHQEQASEEGVKLEIELADGLPAIRLSEPFFVDALDRLLDNAIRFCRREEKRVKVMARVNDALMEIAVQDNGIGIAADQIPHLFERFHQIDREEMEQQGAGLGLAIAHQLVRLHNGEIVVESKLGEGSTFTIRLPIAEEETS
jgi:two-component system sensor histidine kinase ResE